MDSALGELDHLICYAVKANSNGAILRLLNDEGAGFDIVSGGELFRVQRAGGNPATCTFAGVGKSRADYVRAEDVDTGEPLPRITPFRYGASLNYRHEKWEAKIEGQRVSRQNRTAAFETSTEGYTFLNASAGYNFHAGPAIVNVYVRGTNLLNEEAREHLSFLKEALPLAGRGVLIGVRTTF